MHLSHYCVCVSCVSSRKQLERDLVVIAAESEREGEEGAMVGHSSCSQLPHETHCKDTPELRTPL